MRKGSAILAAVCGLVALNARAELKPLWEFGMGVGALAFPDYRGSDSTQTYVVPLPYFVYRGPLLKADRDGARSVFVENESVELNLSLNATTPVRGHSEGARHGMPNLKATVEFGPSVDWHVWHSPDRKYKFDVRVPIRAPFTIEAPPRSIGFVISPDLNLDIADPAGFKDWKLGLATGPVFASRKYHEYFYSVPSRYATPSRPEYRAAGGYGGTAFIVALSKRFPNYWVGGFVRYDTLENARFEASPLVERKNAWFGGIGIAWMIRESKRTVETEE
jgi:outer membrane scaffolding protein for murein synthesis (MipA/OmpV family)